MEKSFLLDASQAAILRVIGSFQEEKLKMENRLKNVLKGNSKKNWAS